MGLRNELDYRGLKRDYDTLLNEHLASTADHRREVEQLLRRNQQQEALLKTDHTMYQKLEDALGKVQTLLLRHLDAGENHVPARALWHVLHEAGITTAHKPELNHKEAVALKNAPKLEQEHHQQDQSQKQEQKQERQLVQGRGMRI
jgi:hypothetical protein